MFKSYTLLGGTEESGYKIFLEGTKRKSQKRLNEIAEIVLRNADEIAKLFDQGDHRAVHALVTKDFDFEKEVAKRVVEEKEKKKELSKAEKNDAARKALGVGCEFIQTAGVNALPMEEQSALREKVEKFNDFNEDNDPYGEHDFGKIVQNAVDYFWKIDDYGEDYKANGAQHRLVLTLMQAREY